MSANLMSLARSGGKFLKLFGDRKMMKQLPYDAEVEYLGSTGTQWIDTGIVPTRTTKIVFDYQLTSQTAGRGLFGSYKTKSSYYIYQNSATAFEVGFGGHKSNAFMSDLYRHEIEFDDLSVLVDGKTVYTGGSYLYTSKYTLLLFTIRSENTIYKGSSAKIFYLEIYDNGVLVRDFVPVRKGNIGYMYDRVSGQLFGNQGTGEFIIGPDKTI